MGETTGRVLAIVPAWNEERNVGDTVREILSIESAYDVVVVDDGSADRTADVAREAGAIVPRFPSISVSAVR